MCEEEVLPRALQNHLLHPKHRTTVLGLCMPQYLSYISIYLDHGLSLRLTRMHEVVTLSLPRLGQLYSGHPQ